MVFTPEEIPRGSPPSFEDTSGDEWRQMYRHACKFPPGIFTEKMVNLILNPNLNSSWLFRADILYDDQNQAQVGQGDRATRPQVREFKDITRQRILVRKLVPRSTKRDAPMNQTCTFHSSQEEDGSIKSLVIYIPHAEPDNMPFYHPKVKGIAHLHEWDPSTGTSFVSVHFLPFPGDSLQDERIMRTAYHLLEILHKHGEGGMAGYVKRVHHDIIVPQPIFQDRYTLLKSKYAKPLLASWAEKTDPLKHVFEDLGIASFLIELWADMYKNESFPGFVDIGCGNGLLVYILNQEGYHGWGFDARSRTSWQQYKSSASAAPTGESLEQRLLLPYCVPNDGLDGVDDLTGTHDGKFPPGTFIISNHADELTPWTPILAADSNCPFIMIPCCSHNLAGEKYRAAPPRDKTKSHSAFASLVDWVTQIAEDCGWQVETEMLRIPSTRNTGLLGRTRASGAENVDIEAVIKKYGGTGSYRETVTQLLKSKPRGH